MERNTPIIRVKDAHTYLSVSKSTLRRIIKSGRLPIVRISARAVGIMRTDFDAYLEKARGAQ